MRSYTVHIHTVLSNFTCMRTCSVHIVFLAAGKLWMRSYTVHIHTVLLNFTYMRTCSVHTVFLAAEKLWMRSYTVVYTRFWLTLRKWQEESPYHSWKPMQIPVLTAPLFVPSPLAPPPLVITTLLLHPPLALTKEGNRQPRMLG